MTQRTLTRSEISDAIADKTGISRGDALNLLEKILEEMSLAIVKHGQLKLSSFGSFNVRSKSTRLGRNPKTGQEVMITPRKAISFRASHILKDRVENPKNAR